LAAEVRRQVIRHYHPRGRLGESVISIGVFLRDNKHRSYRAHRLPPPSPQIKIAPALFNYQQSLSTRGEMRTRSRMKMLGNELEKRSRVFDPIYFRRFYKGFESNQTNSANILN